MTTIRLNGSSQQFRLEHNGVLIGTLTWTGKGIDLLGSSAKPFKAKRLKKKKPSKSDLQDRELLSKANQLGNAYRRARMDYYRGKRNKAQLAAEFKRAFTASELAALKRAVFIMQTVGVNNYHTYVKAQVAGLRFVNKGEGVFPKISQLASDSAEGRLLEYMQAVKDEEGDVVDVEIADEERKTPLNSNMKYLTKRDRIKNGDASREDVVYVMQLQNIRRGRVEKYVMDYLDKLNAESC